MWQWSEMWYIWRVGINSVSLVAACPYISALMST